MIVRAVVADDSLIVRAGSDPVAGGRRMPRGRRGAGLPTTHGGGRPGATGPRARRHPDAAHAHRRGHPRGRRPTRLHPATAVLVVSQYVESAYAMELLDGGQTHIGYLLKDRLLDLATLLAAVGACMRERRSSTRPWSGRCWPGRASGATGALSEREREVLACMAEGLTDRGIAERLHLSPRTVATHAQKSSSALTSRTRQPTIGASTRSCGTCAPRSSAYDNVSKHGPGQDIGVGLAAWSHMMLVETASADAWHDHDESRCAARAPARRTSAHA